MNSTALSVNLTAFFSEAISFLGVVVLSGYMGGYTVTVTAMQYTSCMEYGLPGPKLVIIIMYH